MRVYRAWLWLYPHSFRDEYGNEMQAIFARRWRQTRGAVNRTMLLVEALVDVLRNAPAAHLDVIRQDVQTAWRTIRRAPGLSMTVVTVTAIGIGATTAAFSLADHVLIRPLPFHDPDRLVKVWQLPPGGGRLEASPANFRDWRDRSTSFERIAAFQGTSRNLIGSGDPLRLEGASVVGDLFATLGVSPLAGRTLTIADDEPTAPPAVAISERLWRGRFAADPAILGTTVTLDDTRHVVIGVMPAAFEFPSRLVDFWVPEQRGPGDYVYGNPYLQTIARLKTGVSRDQALAELQQIAATVAQADATADARISVTVIGLRDEVTRQARLLLWILVAAAAGLLLIACTNLANLLLTRGLARQRELAVRAALGARPARLTRQLFTEHLLLALTGAAAGSAVAAGSLPAIAHLVPTNLPVREVPAVDVRLLVAAVIATLVSVVGCGLVPSLRISRHADAGALRGGNRAGVGGRTARLRSMLVVAQISLSVLLLVGSGLLLRAMLKVQSTDPGFRTEGVLTLRTTLPLPKYDSVAVRHQFFDSVLGGVEALPGVSSAAYVTGLPMVMRGRIWVTEVPGYESLPPEERLASLRFVTPRFFATIGIPLRRGRDVAESDTQSSLPVAVVSESFARRYWPGRDPLGRQFKVQGRDRTIVGVAGDVRVRGLEQRSEPQVYLPSRQIEDGALSGYVPRDLVVKSTLAPEGLIPAIRAIVRMADPQQPISNVEPLAGIVSAETAPRRVQVRVLGAFAGIAFLLAGIGLHGLLAYNVSQGAREIGVRIALGAERRRILGMVMHRGLRLAGTGVLTGGVLAIVAGRWLQALLAGVSPTDAATFGGAAALAFAMTGLGSLLPALRAVRVDPLEVMRAE